MADIDPGTDQVQPEVSMTITRRDVLSLSLAGTAVAMAPSASAAPSFGEDWAAVRDLFGLSPDRIHMSSMLVTAHPRPVREAIERYRSALDADPVEFLEDNDERLTEAARQAAGDYVGVQRSHVALTDSTTMSVGLVYSGIVLGRGDEVLTTSQDYFVTHESLRLAARRSGASVRQVSLFDDSAAPDADQMVSRIVEAITPATRLVALTWVHSSTGVKIPAARIGAAIREANASRPEDRKILFGLDAVHGFGIEEDEFDALGCDFYMAGCHKWLFGPRGTGLIAVSERGLAHLAPLVPSFDDSAVMARWIAGEDQPAGSNNGRRLTPGGFKPFEHRWALSEAFALHGEIGRSRIADRTHVLSTQLKEGLRGVSGVSLRTPLDSSLSAGIVSFDVEGTAPGRVVSALRRQGVIASVAPYARPHVRLTPGIINTEAEVDAAVRALTDVV